MCAMFGWFSEASVWASRCEPGEAVGVVREHGFGQDLERDVAIQLRIARAIHLAHAAGAERQTGSSYGPRRAPGSEGQGGGLYGRGGDASELFARQRAA